MASPVTCGQRMPTASLRRGMSKEALNVLERDAELAALAAFIDDIRGDGTHRRLVVEGRADIGKTRLLQSARTLGDSLATTTLTARGSERDSSFATLHCLY